MVHSNMDDWRVEEGVKHCEEVGQVQGYAHPDDGPRRFRKDGEHEGMLLICRRSAQGECDIGLMRMPMRVLKQEELIEERVRWSTRSRK
jgi:hypothetical protein